ncbi:endonuclease [bacterium]|nr:endonuclease [bacterium]
MKKSFLIMLLSLILISCDSTKESKNDFDCSQCNSETEVCNLDEQKCDLKSVFDCSQCDTTYQSCNQTDSKCDLLSGKCLDNSSCREEEECNTTTHQCEQVVMGETIYEVRTKVYSEGTTVTVNGIVTGVVYNGELIQGVFIQESGDSYRGIYIYFKTAGTKNINIGDKISMTGVYTEYYLLSEIVSDTIDSISITSSNNQIFEPKDITASSISTNQVEPYESMIVRVRGDFTVGSESSGNLAITDNSGAKFSLRKDIFSYNLSSGTKLTEIVGVLTYHYQEYKILPRKIEDLVDHSQLCNTIECGNGEICVVENETPSCICNQLDGYYPSEDICLNPCENTPCVEENRNRCNPESATQFTCLCNSGFQDNNGICEAVPYCNPEIYSSAFGLKGQALADELKIIVNRNFSSWGYDDGRIAMFSYIDNDNGTIMCIYTGEYGSHPYVDDFNLLHKGCDGCADKPANEIWNWEHTWPDSQLSDPNAEADLHHLFPTRAYVNSARSNYPFDNGGSDKYCADGVNGPSSCTGYDYISYRNGSTSFEVADQHKGNTARAMYYMLIKYKTFATYINSSQFTVLRAWHSQDEVDLKERSRNDKVEMFQHNRNPFVDCPQFVDALYQ